MRSGRLYILILISLIFSSVYTQDYLAPEVLSVENGLSSRQVNSLIIDQPGFLWVATNNGLNRYDGYRFRHFFTAISNNGYSGIQVVKRIRTDDKGNKWVLNTGGVNRIDHESGEITRFPVARFDTAFHPDALLKDICTDNENRLWILSDRSVTGIMPDNTIKTYPFPAELMAQAIPSCIIADRNKNLWIGTSAGLIMFTIQQEIFKVIVGENSQGLLSNNEVQCLYLDENSRLWVGTRNGLNLVDPVDFSFYQYFPSGTRTVQPVNSIRDIDRKSGNSLLLATDAGIISFYNEQHFTNIFLTTQHHIHSVAIDSFGTIWGSTNKGILKIRESRFPVRNFTTADSPFRMTSNDVVALMVNEPGNKLFAGYNNNGFSVVDTRTLSGDSFTTIDGSPVKGFYTFKPEEYLVLSEHDIEVFIPGGRRTSLFSRYTFMNKELVKDIRINCVYFDGEYGLWLGTSNGIQCIRLDSSRHYARPSFSYQGQRLVPGQVYDIQNDASGNIWFGTENGLVFLNPAKGNINRYTPYDVNLLNTEHKAVYTIVTERAGVFWLGTSGGAYRFNTRTREFTALTRNSEIMNSNIKALSTDKRGNIWIGTENGLFHYARNTNTIRRYDNKDGLLNDSYTTVAAGNSQNIYLGGPLGLSVLDASRISVEPKIPQVLISGIRFIENDRNQEDLFFQVSDTITLPWRRRPIMFEFAVLDLSRPELNQYRYSFGKIRHEQEWQALGTKNYVILDRLSPGKYRFRLTGSGSDGAWNTAVNSVVVIVEAPYWRSKYGLAVIMLAGILLITLFFRFWIRQFFNLSRENQEREMFAKQIMVQKEELTLKNKAITDSINYAKRIQTAMLPPYKLFKSIFPSSFILFMPKDIVSGDFYWVNKVGNKIFIAAVDCTGHGVPGAFMSIIGFELFRKITNIEGLTRPSDILNRLNDDFHEIFKDVDNVVLRDGMDVAFCSIDKKDMILEFSGAFNPLYLIRDNKIMEVKGDRFAIGLDETNFREQTFKNHLIPIQKSDIIYIFSDGFADQFGGPDGKKYKYRRFRHLLLNLHQLPMEKQHEILENNVLEWRGEQEQVDDILVIGIKIDF